MRLLCLFAPALPLPLLFLCSRLSCGQSHPLPFLGNCVVTPSCGVRLYPLPHHSFSSKGRINFRLSRAPRRPPPPRRLFWPSTIPTGNSSLFTQNRAAPHSAAHHNLHPLPGLILPTPTTTGTALPALPASLACCPPYCKLAASQQASPGAKSRTHAHTHLGDRNVLSFYAHPLGPAPSQALDSVELGGPRQSPLLCQPQSSIPHYYISVVLPNLY